MCLCVFNLRAVKALPMNGQFQMKTARLLAVFDQLAKLIVRSLTILVVVIKSVVSKPPQTNTRKPNETKNEPEVTELKSSRSW